MTTYTFDTSGSVPMPSAHGGTVRVLWGGLDPFTQGYVQAMFASMEQQDGSPILRDPPTGKIGSGLARYVGFDSLAPKTLERIMEDCASHLSVAPKSGFTGAQWWAYRGKRGLTPYLGADRKVHLREVGA
jgi:hypothetical protein